MHWQARKTYRSYSIPLGYKDLLVVQMVLVVAEKRGERILPVFQEGYGQQLERKRGFLREDLSHHNNSEHFQLQLHC